MAWRTLKAFTGFLTIWSVGACGAFVGTHISCPARWTQALTSFGITFAIILTTTVLFTLSTVFTIRTLVFTSYRNKTFNDNKLGFLFLGTLLRVLFSTFFPTYNGPVNPGAHIHSPDT